MEIIQLSVSELNEYKNNAKTHSPEQIKSVANSIERFGMVQPIVVDDNNTIVIGHCRYRAAKELGMTRIPCVKMSGLTEDEIKALRLADNKTNESEWDYDALSEEIKKLDGIELQDFGFIEYEMLVMSDEDVDEQITPEKIDKTETADTTKRKIIIMHSDEEIEWIKSVLGIETKNLKPAYRVIEIMGGDSE